MLRPIVERLVPDVSQDRNASIFRDPVDEDTGCPVALCRSAHNLHLHNQLNRISPLNFLHFLRSTKPMTSSEFMSHRYRYYRAWCFMIFPSPFTQFQGSASNTKTLQPLYTSLTVLPIDNIQYKLVRMSLNEQAHISHSQTACSMPSGGSDSTKYSP